ncbi:MAG: type II secretion system minor pseudopilin GspK [Bacteriovoracaceae bacterium]|jgi:general secretion pathway protein K|nr:type II secretion system minor pseudopilin GspK [Bacteriovoracaceae bacterium]HNR50137.1 type II secretion system minor pseudopilin GspK [Deltaproteobacteria bacterium]HRR20793.1 type II secretion system minor pseudopilin GspK [Desulfomonilia bacterium]HOD71700.1 type II secretion system minor pseudopilin GspK [Deltaproteobacteria bacterium]HPL87463.1 type II secretion system minor pseudopilin GspK [Deltaproteobacteria bacterium]
MMRILADRRGVVLLLVLATVALFTAMVITFSADQGLDMELAYNFRDSVQAQHIARAGVEAARAILKSDDPSYDADDEEWGSFSEYALAASAYLEGPAFGGTLADECGKIDLNSLVTEGEQVYREAQFKYLFELLEIDITSEELDELAKSLKDWLDADDQPEFGGAESDYYRSLDPPYICKNGPLDAPEEILLVKGMKPEYYYGTENYHGIRDYVTVGTGGKININTAPSVVLMSMSRTYMTEDVAESIEDGRPFLNEQDIGRIQGLDLSDPSDEMAWIKKNLDVKSSMFSADVNGHMPSGARINVRAVLQRFQSDVRIVYYKIY